MMTAKNKPYSLLVFFNAIFFTLWFVSNNELIDLMILGVIVLISLAYFFLNFRKSKKLSLNLLLLSINLIFISWVTCGHVLVVKEVDGYASDFIKKYNCHPPDGRELFLDNTKWKQISPAMWQLTFNKFGATRRIIYQQPGLIRYGFLYDDKKAIWLSKCE